MLTKSAEEGLACLWNEGKILCKNVHKKYVGKQFCSARLEHRCSCRFYYWLLRFCIALAYKRAVHKQKNKKTVQPVEEFVLFSFSKLESISVLFPSPVTAAQEQWYANSIQPPVIKFTGIPPPRNKRFFFFPFFFFPSLTNLPATYNFRQLTLN